MARIFEYHRMVLGDLGGMGSDVRLGRMVEGSAVMRGRAGNARLGSV